MKMDIGKFLQTVPTFSDFTREQLGILEHALCVDQFPADHVLLRQGQKGHTLYILMEGEIEVSRTHKSGRGVDNLGVVKAGEVFGLQSLIDHHPRYSSCRTITPVTTASLPESAFTLLYNSHISLAEHFQYIVAQHLVRELRRLDEAVVHSIRQGDIQPLVDAATNGDRLKTV